MLHGPAPLTAVHSCVMQLTESAAVRAGARAGWALHVSTAQRSSGHFATGRCSCCLKTRGWRRCGCCTLGARARRPARRRLRAHRAAPAEPGQRRRGDHGVAAAPAGPFGTAIHLANPLSLLYVLNRIHTYTDSAMAYPFSATVVMVKACEPELRNPSCRQSSQRCWVCSPRPRTAPAATSRYWWSALAALARRWCAHKNPIGYGSLQEVRPDSIR